MFIFFVHSSNQLLAIVAGIVFVALALVGGRIRAIRLNAIRDRRRHRVIRTLLPLN